AAEHHVELADGTPALVATATLDPATMADGGRRARPGRWKIGALIAIAGFESSVYQLRTADGEPVMLEVSPPG
ncbi:MAG: hypothetical protein QOI80_559, partial [Solirubrobacteraceae bacterium]|nr:hypothetical protein [Solirubrobacteraceae bacterium]